MTAVDVIAEKVEKINRRESPIQDEYIEKYFAEKELDLVATLDGASAYRDAEFVKSRVRFKNISRSQAARGVDYLETVSRP